MFYHSMWMLVHPTHLVLSSATLSNEILCVKLTVDLLDGELLYSLVS